MFKNGRSETLALLAALLAGIYVHTFHIYSPNFVKFGTKRAAHNTVV
jgi:hypothetical protein